MKLKESNWSDIMYCWEIWAFKWKFKICKTCIWQESLTDFSIQKIESFFSFFIFLTPTHPLKLSSFWISSESFNCFSCCRFVCVHVCFCISLYIYISTPTSISISIAYHPSIISIYRHHHHLSICLYLNVHST